ncbi:protein Son [Eupeodes corollae]|uniref:protein Son n=1 Tax=Eupeodes corollae TaxID=290404 RepID=UPI00248FF538|nr:protein Son [Eupeodes corollae]
MSSSEPLIESVKVKQEKLDPEIEQKLNPKLLLPDSTNLQDPDGETQVDDEKKNIAPVKSSNEILAELFMVFNATPPEELLSIDKVSRKSKKEHKKSKHKKSKKRKRKTEDNCDKSDNENESLEAGGSKVKREKHKHKHKHKKSKEKDEDKIIAASDGTVIMAADSSSSSKIKQSIKKEPSDEVEIKVEKSHSKRETRSRVEKRLSKCTRVEEGSDISLSDEETYLRERSHYRDRDTTESTSRSSKYERQRNSFYRSSNSYYSGDRIEKNHQRHHHHHQRSRSRSRHRTRTRSRSKERSSLGIDKKRLLEIARKNAITMFKSGSLPGCDGMSEEVKDKVLMKMRYGGKTVQDLTNFCKKLSKGENYDDLSEFSSDEQSDVDKQGNAKAFHHPFVLKDREPIVMHIKNATPIAPKTADQKKAITMQFPVSSGQQHRLTEGWVPVPAKEPKPPTPPPSVAKQVLSKPIGVPKNVFQKQLPVVEQQPAFKPAAANEIATNVAESVATTPREDLITVPPYLPPIVPPIAPPIAPLIAPLISPPIVPPVAPVVAMETSQVAPAPAIFPVAASNMDVSTIISQRLSAMRRLQENPMDCEAIKMMYTSQKEMTSWASSKNMPGQFTGSTGANILSARELTKGTQAWARKDQLTSTVPVSGGMGMHLLKKMGWKPGEGLGREKTGSLQPLLLDVKLDKRGLVADEEVNNGIRQQQAANPSKRKKNTNNGSQATAKQAIDSKHPVCLLNELSSKRKWTPPMYELVLDEGPSHSKLFVFSVNVNGQVFNPGTGGNTKKEAKMLTAKFCLQQMGVLS